MIPVVIRTAAQAHLEQLETEMNVPLAFFPGLEQAWPWGYTFPYSTRSVVEGDGIQFPTGPIVVAGQPPRAMVGPSAVRVDRLGDWVMSQF